MKDKYTAIIYIEKTIEILRKTGNDIDELFIWIVTEATQSTDDLHGKVIDNKSHKTIRKFQKTQPDD